VSSWRTFEREKLRQLSYLIPYGILLNVRDVTTTFPGQHVLPLASWGSN
jgi:hypothetical protein